jgi:hypothetical protein
MNDIRPLISRTVAPFIGALVLWMSRQIGVALPGVAEALTTTVELVIFAVVTGVSHKLIDRRVNPLDAAASTIPLTQLPQVRAVDVPPKSER